MSPSYTALNEQKRQCAKRRRPIIGRRSFTLIELLVVVAIIALLISILLPSLNAARDASKRTVCMANLHAIGVAMNSYANNYLGFLPGYKQIGQTRFRVSFQNLKTGQGATPYRELFGVNSILHSDQYPKVLPNGMYYIDDVPTPVYVPGDSKVWMCPSNLGPFSVPQFRTYGNTYASFCNAGKLDPNNWQSYNQESGFNVGSPCYNLDQIAADPTLRRSMCKIPLVYDSYMDDAGPPGQIPDGTSRKWYDVTDPNQQRQPHRASGFMNKGNTGVWIGLYADSHCQMNGWNK
jgi:prepilin-type N-terminal cleavage/methylation domain-containing protein